MFHHCSTFTCNIITIENLWFLCDNCHIWVCANSFVVFGKILLLGLLFFPNGVHTVTWGSILHFFIFKFKFNSDYSVKLKATNKTQQGRRLWCSHSVTEYERQKMKLLKKTTLQIAVMSPYHLYEKSCKLSKIGYTKWSHPLNITLRLRKKLLVRLQNGRARYAYDCKIWHIILYY